MRIMLRH